MKIKEHRKRMQMTQNELADAVGITQGYVCQLERGDKINPTFFLLLKIADTLHVSVGDLYEESRECGKRLKGIVQRDAPPF